MNGITHLLSASTEQALNQCRFPVLLSYFGLQSSSWCVLEPSVPVLQARKRRPKKVNAGPKAVPGCRVQGELESRGELVPVLPALLHLEGLCPAPRGAKVWAVLGRVQAGRAAQVLGVGACLGAQEHNT